MYKTLLYFLSSLRKRLHLLFTNPAAMLHPLTMIDADHEIDGVFVHFFSLGSEPAFRRIYDLYAPAIYRVSIHYYKSEQLASELVQEVFSKLWLNRAKFSTGEEVRRYLFTTAQDAAVRYMKKMVEKELEMRSKE